MVSSILEVDTISSSGTTEINATFTRRSVNKIKIYIRFDNNNCNKFKRKRYRNILHTYC